MLNELLKDEELGRILFAHLLNQNGCDTGVDTEQLFYNQLKEINGEDNMEDIPMNIRELEEKGKDTERLAEPSYYAGNGLSPLEAFKKGLLSKDEYIGFCKGNVIKYTVRAGKKENASEDIVKAIDYLRHLKELYESDAYYIDKAAERIVKEAIEGLDKIEDVEPRI